MFSYLMVSHLQLLVEQKKIGGATRPRLLVIWSDHGVKTPDAIGGEPSRRCDVYREREMEMR